VCGDGEYVIYTAMVLRNKSYGIAQEFVWAQDSSEYATREGSSTIKVFKNFTEKKIFKPEFGAEGIFIHCFSLITLSELHNQMGRNGKKYCYGI
jgi:coatomer subunit beta'